MGNATNAEIVTLDVVETFKTDGTTVTSLDTVEVVTTTNVITAAEGDSLRGAVDHR